MALTLGISRTRRHLVVSTLAEDTWLEYRSYLLGTSQNWGSLVVRVMVGSCRSGLKQSSCQSKQGQSFALHHQWCSVVNGQC